MRRLLLSAAWAVLVCPALASGAEQGRRWDFEKAAAGWRATDKGCGVAAEPGAARNHVFRIVATRPHHTRAVLDDGTATSNFLITLRVRLLDYEGAAPNVYVYGRAGSGGFRGLRLHAQGGDILCWYGRATPSVRFGPLGARLDKGAGWVHVAFACFGEHAFAKAWPAGTPEPGWQAEGKAPGHRSGEVALGVWTSPRTPSKATVLFDDVRVVPVTRAMLAGLKMSPSPRPRLDVAALPRAPAAFELPDRIGLVASRTAVAFDRATGEMANLVDVATGREFVSPDVKAPLFRIVLTRPYAAKRMELASRGFRKIHARKGQGNSLVLDFSGHPGSSVSVRVAASLSGDGAVRFGIRVANRSEWCVASVAFPLFAAPAALGGDDADDRMLLPWSSGAVLPTPGRRGLWRDAVYPGAAFAQFYALYDEAAGLYVAMDDAAGHCKRLRLRCQAGRSVSLGLEHLFPEVARRDAELPYSVLIRTFRGDWRDAAAIYKAWAVRQPWCARRLAERDDIPQFLKDGAGIIVAGIQNPAGRARLLGERLEKLPGWLDAYRRRTGLKHMVFVPYGWENRGTWAGINYLPTVPSDELWQKANAELKRRGHRTAFLTSGYWWVVKRQRTSNGPAFDDTADFGRRKGMAVLNAAGSPCLVDFYGRTRAHGSWRGLSATLCHGSREASATLKRVFLHLAGLGVSLISFDQEIGGGQRAPCYSRAHGHPPGHGNWMWTGFRDLCAEILREGKPVQPELGLFLENVSELAIPYMATYWSRQFGEVDVGVPGGRGVGLFSYLYHEHVTAIGAACVQGQGAQGTRPHPWLRCRVLANNLTRGLIPGPFHHDVPLEPRSDWQRLVSRAYFAFCQPYKHFPEYLLLGRAVRPLPVTCRQAELWFWRRDARKGKPLRKGGPPVVKTPIKLPVVTAGSFEAADRSVAVFVVNTTPEPQEAAVTLPAGTRTTVHRADRAEVQRLGASPVAKKAQLSLEPFGIRVLVMRSEK